MARRASNTSVLPRGLEVRYASLDDDALPLSDVASVVYCASMGFGHVPRLLLQLERAGVRRAVFVSTTAIFTTIASTSRAVRVEAEEAVRASALDWTILRPTMIYGTARDRNISRLLRFLSRFPVFPIVANALWQPIHVHDLADGVVSALDSSTTVGHVYNLAGAEPLRFADLVRAAAHAVNRRNLVLLPAPLHAAVLAARLTHVVTPEQVRRLAEDKAFDITDARRDFAFNPRSFEEGVSQEALELGLIARQQP